MQKRTMLMALSLVLAGAASAHPMTPAGADDAAVDKAVMATRDAIQKAVLAKDAARLQTLYMPSFTHTHGSGKVDGRSERIVSLMTADPTVEMAPVANWAIASHAGTTAIVRGTAPILNRKENQYYQFRWIQVYVKDDEGWKMAASQATRLSDAPVPAADPTAAAMAQIGAKPASSAASAAR